MQKAVTVILSVANTSSDVYELNKYLEEGWKVVSHTSVNISEKGETKGAILVIIEK